MSELETVMQHHKKRLTAPRRLVFEALQAAPRPLSMAELTRQLGDIDRTSIYRTLDLFVSLRIIDIITTGWKRRYELAEPFKPHHHHLQCTSCNELIAINTPEIETVIADTANSYNYQLLSHHIELFGVCYNCQKTG